MAEKQPASEPGEPPSVAALSLAETATEPVKKAAEQEINPWDVSAAVDDEGNTLAFDYEAISRYRAPLPFFIWPRCADECPASGTPS